MRLYELTVLLRPELSKKQVEKFSSDFAEVLAELDGRLSKKEYWGLRTLAYLVKKHKTAHYVFMNIAVGQPSIGALDKLLRHNEDVLRYLFVHVEKHVQSVSPIMQSWQKDNASAAATQPAE